MSMGGKFSFLPWVKNSLTRIAKPRANTLRPVVAVRLSLAVSGGGPPTDEALRDVAVHGPGDVIGLQPEAVLKTTPPTGEQQYPASQLVSIEFGEEDLPWRYSPEEIPTTGTASQQVAPWCFLLVLKADEFMQLPQDSAPLPAIAVASLANAFPASNNRWAWAHVQTIGEVAPAAVDGFLEGPLKANPDLAFSRVFSPRRLEALTDYHAFLVPAYEAGRLAGLGKPLLAGLAADWCAWDTPASYTRPLPSAFPVYYQWQFRTSEAVDFEALASLLKPEMLVSFGTQPLSLTTPLSSAGSATPPRQQYVLDLPGVMQELGAPVMQTIPELQTDLLNTIRPSVPATPPLRPIVTPPVYGRAYTEATDLTSSQNPNNWLRQVNLHPGYRAMAAIGTRVVQDNQEQYMQKAWEQVHDIIAANMNLRGMQSGLQTTSSLRNRHLPLVNSGTTAFRAASSAAPSRGEAPSEAGVAAAQTTEPSAENTFSAEATSPEAAFAPSYENTSEGTFAAATGALVMENYGLHLAALSLPRILDPNSGQTLLETIRRSNMPLAAFSPTFRRLLKPFGRYQTNLAGRPLRPSQPPEKTNSEVPRTLLEPNQSLQQQDSLLALLAAGTITAAPPKYPFVLGYQFDDVSVQSLLNSGEVRELLELWVMTPEGEYYPAKDNQLELFWKAFESFSQATFITEKQEEPPTLNLEAVKEAVIEGTDPGPVFLARANRAISFLPHYQDEEAEEGSGAGGQVPVEAGFAARSTAATAARVTQLRPQLLQAVQPVMAYPVFKDPMGPVLQQRHPEMFLPNLSEFPANTVTLLQYNQAFIEAYLLGLNHAFGSELLWRDYPTDLRGSYFRQFWDVSEFLHTNPPPAPVTAAKLAEQEEDNRDIRPLDEWDHRALGTNRPVGAPEPSTLLAIRGELLKRYPTTVVCAAPAFRNAANNNLEPDLSRVVYPLHRGTLGQDITLFSFELPASQLKGNADYPNGHFFVLHERPGEPQFGLDYLRANTTSFSTWDDLAWTDLANTVPGANIRLSDLTAVGPPSGSAVPFTRVASSAQFAYAVFQQPFLVAIHASNMMR